MSPPINTGMPWTVQEEQDLNQRFSFGRSLQELADLNGRSVLAIEWRLAKIAAKDAFVSQSDFNVSNGCCTMDYILKFARKYKVPTSSIYKWINDLELQFK